MRLMDGVRLAVGTLSVFPVRVERVDRQVAGRAMTLAPAVGLVLGLVAGLPLLLPAPPLLGAALAVGLLALLTRGLHLDGLADLADGLGSGKPADQALGIMKKSDIGPFGVMTLVFTLLVQVAAVAEAGYWALVTACVAGRLALVWACRAGVPAARPEGLGAMVAGTVRRSAAWLVTLGTALTAVAIGLLADVWSGVPGDVSWWPEPVPASTEVYGMVRTFPTDAERIVGEVGGWLSGPAGAPIALLAGTGVALLLLRHARRRLDGITGDVLGALVETATAAALVAWALFP
ncbi:adenosylcobinamide-GDP ribazoletransferase [Nonomuraea sp. NPDC048892]|uniref:adenosylcobinamide-GDP ribazoletransferase n=1 Tax=Nonomuraea sp. NPDC048892 TaxID=3154624 RepID=UPI0033F32708